MRDLFDDFMEELRRREAIARGEDPGPPRKRGGDDPDGRDPQHPDGRDEDESGDDSDPADDRSDQVLEEPRRIDERRRRARRGGRPPGGPNDGGGGRAARFGRRMGIAIVVLAVLGVILLFSVGLDLWTDALWYTSVGFDSVFWTRLIATVGLGGIAFVVALIVLLGNLWLAGRLAPPPNGEPGTFRSWVDRFNEAAAAADARRDRSSAFGGWRDRYDPSGGGGARPVVIEAPDFPDMTPLAGWIIGAVAVLIALVIGASMSGAWETVLLWIHRVPFSPTASVTDPIFGRDIGFFLFELPFLRLIQGLFNGIVIAALLVALARYLVSAANGGLVFTTPVRVHLAVLGALFLLSVAFEIGRAHV